MRSTSRQQLMNKLNAKQKNPMWSWCGINEENKKVYFSIWEDKRERRGNDNKASYIVQEPHWGIDEQSGVVSPARKDHDEKISLALDGDYHAFGYIVVAKDPKAKPREIGRTKTSFIFELELKKCPDGTIIAYPERRIEIK